MVSFRGHGGGGWKEGLLDFSTNINPLGTPKELTLFIRNAVEQGVYSHHPSELGDDLRESIAKYEGTDEGLVYVFNGATEALQLIMMYLRPRVFCTVVPNYTDYFRIARLIGINAKTTEYWGSHHINEDFIKECGANSMLVVSNPNTPLGYLMEPDDLLSIISIAEELKMYVLVDESFMDFVEPGKSLINKTRELRNLIIVKSYTKFLAIPGLRVGAAFSSIDLEDLVPTWPVNSITEYAVSKYLPKALDFREETLGFIGREGRRVLNEMESLGIEIFKSRTHYFTFKGHPNLWIELKKRGVLIRDLSNVQSLGPGFFRFSLRKPQDNDELIKALMDIVRVKN